jgi:hypothetical protein
MKCFRRYKIDDSLLAAKKMKEQEVLLNVPAPAMFCGNHFEKRDE